MTLAPAAKEIIMFRPTDSVSHTILAALGLLFIWSTVLIVYRLCFHRLAKFPGPKIAAATYWYECYYDILCGPGGQFTFQIEEMQRRYGPIVRVNPEELHIQDPTFHDKLYGRPGQVRNKYAPHACITGVTHGSFSTVDHYLHRARRAAIAPLYSKKSVIHRQKLICDRIEHLYQVLQRQSSRNGSCEVRTTYLAYSTEVIFRYFFGEKANLLEDEESAVFWKDTIEAVAFLVSNAKQWTWLIPLAKRTPVTIVSLFSRRLGKAVKMHKDMYARSMAAYSSGDVVNKASSEHGESYRTVFQTILASRLPDAEKLPQRMSDEGIVTLAAGSETVSRVLVTATFHLLDNPASCKQLQDELRHAIPDPQGIPDIGKMEQLTYLNAVVKESLRLASITMSRLPIVSPKESLRYDDWVIPVNTPVAMTPHKILMDSDIYPSPTVFRPERWLSTGGEAQRANHHFVVFQKGNRSCAGINLGQAQLRLVIATLFRRFELELVDTIRERDIDPIRDCFVGMPSSNCQGVKIAIRRNLS